MEDREQDRNLAIFAALPVLEAAARHGSFTRAAREFGLTQGALSRRIQGLERDLGLALFARRGRTIEITEAGARLAEAARASQELIEAVRHDLGDTARGLVRIGVLPSLGSCWLAPRLADFQHRHPDIALNVTTIDADFRDGHKDPVTWDPSAIDLAITRGHGGWRTLEAVKIADEAMVPVRAPRSKATVRLVHSTRTGAWADYDGGSTVTGERAPATLSFEHFYMLIEAARAGAGIALLPDLFVSADLTSGRLEACGPARPSGARYYLLGSTRAIHRPAVSAFIRWAGAKGDG